MKTLGLSMMGALFLVLAACSSDGGQANASHSAVTEIGVTFGDSVRYEHRMTATSGIEITSRTTLNGLEFEIRTTGEQITIHLGSHSFGDLRPGDEVHFEESGIFVNDERRWDMPLR